MPQNRRPLRACRAFDQGDCGAVMRGKIFCDGERIATIGLRRGRRDVAGVHGIQSRVRRRRMARAALAAALWLAPFVPDSFAR